MRGRIGRLALAAMLALGFGASAAGAAEPLKVVVTIKPIHSLVAAIMEGAGTPELLIEGAGSPHSYAMRPSDARRLSSADIVIRVSENLEGFLEKPIESLSQGARIVTLADLPGVRLLPLRQGGAFEPHEHDHTAAVAHEGPRHGRYDAHLWLNPVNAAVVAERLANILAKARPEQTTLFKTNAAKLEARIAALDAELAGALDPVKNKEFIVFHDAYQYFEAHFGLEAAGSLTVSPERQPGAARLKAIRDKVAATGSVCVFAEPQFKPKLLDTIVEGTDARIGVLDPLGASLPAGPELYFALMRGLAKQLNDCLAGRA